MLSFCYFVWLSTSLRATATSLAAWRSVYACDWCSVACANASDLIGSYLFPIPILLLGLFQTSYQTNLTNHFSCSVRTLWSAQRCLSLVADDTNRKRHEMFSGLQDMSWMICTNREFQQCACTGTWTLLPHPTPPVTDHKGAVQCLCLQDSKKDDEVAVPVCAQEHERYYPTPPHPTGNWSWKSSAVPVSAGQQERWWGCCAWPHVPAPCPQVLP